MMVGDEVVVPISTIIRGWAPHPNSHYMVEFKVPGLKVIHVFPEETLDWLGFIPDDDGYRATNPYVNYNYKIPEYSIYGTLTAMRIFETSSMIRHLKHPLRVKSEINFYGKKLKDQLSKAHPKRDVMGYVTFENGTTVAIHIKFLNLLTHKK